MAYDGVRTSKTALIVSNQTTYPLSAAATEVAYTEIFDPIKISTGEGILVRLRGTTAGNANAKTILMALAGGTTINIQNNTTTNANNLDFLFEVFMMIQSGSTVTFDAKVMFNGVAAEIQTGTGTITLASGSPRVTVSVTGGAANDVILYGIELFHIKLEE